MVVSSGGSRIFLRGGANSQRPITLQMFCRKLYENERIWTGGRPWCPPGSANGFDNCFIKIFSFQSVSLNENLGYLKTPTLAPEFHFEDTYSTLHKKVHTNFRERNKFYEYSEDFGDQSYSRNDTLADCGSVVRKSL